MPGGILDRFIIMTDPVSDLPFEDWTPTLPMDDAGIPPFVMTGFGPHPARTARASPALKLSAIRFI
jgi:hypothetical protein